MTNLITDQEEIRKISNSLEMLRSKGYNQKTIEKILEELIPRNEKCLINYQVTDNDNEFLVPACFVYDNNIINISLTELKNYVELNTKKIRLVFSEEVEEKTKEELRNDFFYEMVMFVILHEIEHVKQYFISEGFIECQYKTVVNLYKNMIKLNLDVEKTDNKDLMELRKNWNEIKKILFYINSHRNSHKFLLERNANLVAHDALSKLCKYEENLTFLPYFEYMSAYYIVDGYQGIWNGAAERSYHKLHIGKIFNNLLVDEEIPVDDRVCYGLPLDIKTRVKVVNKKFKI